MRWTEAAGSALGHDVRAVQEEGDAAEALGLALRAEVAAGLVQALEAGVLLRACQVRWTGQGMSSSMATVALE